MANDNKISIQTKNSDDLRYVQRILTSNQIPFVTSSLPEDRTLKVILRGVPADITEDELQTGLVNGEFNIIQVKIFGSVERPMLIC